MSQQDWDVELKTNRQRISLQAAQRGHRVIFLETNAWLVTYLRNRNVPWRTKLRRLFRTEVVAPGVHVRRAVNPFPCGWRWHRAGRANSRVEAWRLRRLLRDTDPRSWSILAYDPRATHLADALPQHRPFVYDCVDDHAAAFPPGHRATVRRHDQAATTKATTVITTSSGLYEAKRQQNPSVRLVPNVADYDHFSTAPDIDPAPELADVSAPLLGFVGTLARYKFDFSLVAEVAAQRPTWNIVLIGPVHADDEATLQQLTAADNVRWVGPVAYDRLPRWVARFDVGIIPYISNEYTESCFPLKLYEYLAAGVPVVSTGLPSLPTIEPDVLPGSTASEVIAIVEAQLAASTAADRARRQAVASEHTWERRADGVLPAVSRES